MKMTTGKLGLQIPIQNSSKQLKIKLDTETIKQWRTNLPTADIGATAKELFLLLNEMNQVVLEANQRFTIIELLRPPLQLVCQMLRKHYIHQTTALTKQKLTIANLAQTLQLEMANSYKIALEDLQTNINNTTKPLLQLIIYRIMYYYHAILLRNYQTYSPTPAGIWQELHLLYIFAKDNNLLQNNINELITNKEQPATIITCYLYSLLLAATDPYKWCQTELDILNNALPAWISLATLTNPAKIKPNKPGLFKIDLHSDLPPEPLNLKQQAPTNTTIILDINKICNHLHDIAKKLTPNATTYKINPQTQCSATFLQHLLNSWDTIITRQYKRFEVNCKMQAVFGLLATHHYISNGIPFDANPKITKQPTLLAKQEQEPTKATSNLTEPALNLELLDIEASGADTEDPSKKFIIYDCSLLDVSPNGFCLLWECDSYPLIQPGEIIATRTGEDANNNSHLWNIGVVRWLKHTADNKLKVGVQLLAANAKAAGAQIIKDKEPSGYFLRCLILPSMEASQVAQSLITPTLPFKLGKTINLYTVENTTTVTTKLTKQLDATNTYRQFEFTTISEIEQPTNIAVNQAKIAHNKTTTQEVHNKLAGNEDIDKFNSIWDKL